MKLSKILRPSSTIGKFLFLGLLIFTVYSMYKGHFVSLQEYLSHDDFTYKLGVYNINLYAVMSGLLVTVTLFWVTAIIASFLEGRILKIRTMRNASRVLIAKFVQIFLYLTAGLFALRIIGIDLTVFSVFGGAIGIGLGFGLQKTASNFISGIIMLSEKTIDLGDLLELSDGTFGFVRKISARYTLIETFETKEIIVPNEDMMTSKVVNHTLSNTTGRVDVKVGVSYASDMDKVHEIILAAATNYPGAAKNPPPDCFMTDFGDSSVDFLLHFWVGDVKLGRFKPKSDVLFEIWHNLKKNGIEIPFPQRDLHIKTIHQKLGLKQENEKPQIQS